MNLVIQNQLIVHINNYYVIVLYIMRSKRRVSKGNVTSIRNKKLRSRNKRGRYRKTSLRNKSLKRRRLQKAGSSTNKNCCIRFKENVAFWDYDNKKTLRKPIELQKVMKGDDDGAPDEADDDSVGIEECGCSTGKDSGLLTKDQKKLCGSDQPIPEIKDVYKYDFIPMGHGEGKILGTNYQLAQRLCSYLHR